MSSLKNAVPQRPYRERDQPQARARHGLLEKHKDYSARAKDYNLKKAKLKRLRQKASDRNEDEFHFGMMSSRSKDGVRIAERGNKALSNDVIKLLKTQDAGYLRTVRARTVKERERLENQIQLFEDASGGGTQLRGLKQVDGIDTENRHTVFVDSETDRETFDPEAWFDTDKDGLERAYNRPRGKKDQAQSQSNTLDSEEHRRSQQKMLAKLEALKTREGQLQEAERELEIQRAKMNNTVGGVNKNGVRFKVRQRKR